MTDEDRIRRGHQAQHELIVTRDAFQGVRDFYLQQIAGTPTERPETVLEYHRRIAVLEDVRQALVACVNDGLVVEAQAEALAKLN